MKNLIIFSLLALFIILTQMPKTLTLGQRKFFRPEINFNFAGRRIYRDLSFHLGLDLQGGTHLVYQADMSKIENQDRDSAILAARNNI